VVTTLTEYVGALRWLDNFAYRTSVGPELFLVSGGLVLLIAVLSVSYQPIRAGLMNPAHALRYE